MTFDSAKMAGFQKWRRWCRSPLLILLFALPATGFTPSLTCPPRRGNLATSARRPRSPPAGLPRFAAPLQRGAAFQGLAAETGGGTGVVEAKDRKWDAARVVDCGGGREIVLRKGRPHELDILAILSIEVPFHYFPQPDCLLRATQTTLMAPSSRHHPPHFCRLVQRNSCRCDHHRMNLALRRLRVSLDSGVHAAINGLLGHLEQREVHPHGLGPTGLLRHPRNSLTRAYGGVLIYEP